MTTYNTYQEAKIANPECNIFTKAGRFIGEGDIGPSHHTYEYRGIAKCNPADYCMTVEKFLADGYKFVNGDWFINYGELVVNVGRGTLSVAVANAKQRGDSRSYILRAAALEDKTEGDFWAGLESSINEEKPRTKVEYVEVTDSIFDLRPDFEAGELFSKVNHARDYSTINNTQTLAQALHQSCCYRRIETTMTDREAFIEALQSVWVIDGVDGQEQINKIVNSGKFKIVNHDSDFLRSRIRAVAEWEMNTSNNHDWESVAESIYCAVDDLLKS